MRILILVILLFSNSLLADEIHFKNGCILTNVIVVDSLDSKYQFTRTDNTHGIIIKKAVKNILFQEVLEGEETDLVNCSVSNNAGNAEINRPQSVSMQNETNLNSLNFGLAIVSSVLAWDYFANANDLPTNSNPSIDQKRTRSIVAGSVLAAFAVYNLFHSFDSVSLKVDPVASKLEVQYRF